MTEAKSLALPAHEESTVLAQQWRWLGRAATLVAILTSPAVFVSFHKHEGWNIGWSVFVAILAIAAFRGFVDLVLRRVIPWPSLFGTDDARLRDEDVVNRRRVAFWRLIWLLVRAFLVVVLFTLVYRALVHGWGAANPATVTKSVAHWLVHLKSAARSAGPFLVILPVFFIFNFVILMGPMLLMGITQIRGFEPGDADWGVRLEDVRGQKEAKEEVRRIVSLWQSGQLFEAAGGKRERGLLFLGAPGTGKTMLAKAIATGFNCPIVTIPGSGFAQTFMGMDAVIVRWLARKAKKLAKKWGGQCIVFIDEIDAVGMRRQALGGATPGMMSPRPESFHDFCFYGPHGALNPTEDLILESRAWRERLVTPRRPAPPSPNPFVARLGGLVNQVV